MSPSRPNQSKGRAHAYPDISRRAKYAHDRALVPVESEPELETETANEPGFDEIYDLPEPVAGAVTVLDALNTVAGPAAEAMFLSVEDARQELRHLSHFPGARSVLSDLYRPAARPVCSRLFPDRR